MQEILKLQHLKSKFRAYLVIGQAISRINAGVGTLATGDGGSIGLDVGNLSINNGGRLSTSTAGEGAGGIIDIQAQNVNVEGFSQAGASSAISADVLETATGSGGQVNVTAQNVTLSQTGKISAKTAGRADGGNLLLKAGQVRVLSGGQITTEATGAGDAGNIQITATEVDVTGVSQETKDNSQITAFSNSDFAAGSVTISTQQLSVTERGQISVSNQSTGDSGLLSVNARKILLDQAGKLRADVNGGEQGNIQLQVSETLTLRRGSSIVANATGASTGGNIQLSTRYLLAVPNENSDISANAENSFGGRVLIKADGIIGIEARESPTPQSDITVSSALGSAFGGTIDISTLAIDPSKSLAKLSESLTDANQQVRNACYEAAGNTFNVASNGGTPSNPLQSVLPSSLWVDQRPTPSLRKQKKQRTLAAQPNHQIHEAQGWQRDQHGNLSFYSAAKKQFKSQYIARNCLAENQGEG